MDRGVLAVLIGVLGLVAAAEPAPATPGQPSVLYKCIGPDGVPAYVTTAYPGCVVISVQAPSSTHRPVAQPRAYLPSSFHGYPCRSNCSGHEAGYEWAEDNGITDPNDCGGNSQSFIEGCQAYAEEHG